MELSEVFRGDSNKFHSVSLVLKSVLWLSGDCKDDIAVTVSIGYQVRSF